MYPTNYIGSELTDAECDEIALARFDKKLFKDESELQQACWFDYRFMHPVKRTYLFAHTYVQNYKAAYEKHVDINSEKIFGISRPNDPLDNRPANVGPNGKAKSKLSAPTCLWKARQMADGLCIPYHYFTSVGLDAAIKNAYNEALFGRTASDNSKTRMKIQPSILYSEKISDLILEKWDEINTYRINWVDSERLVFNNEEMNSAVKPHKYKTDAELYLLKQIHGKRIRGFALQKAVDARMLRPQLASKAFPKEQIIY
jgi:hypothetical protein